jgi:N6-adenosine-specific RNA methylase IME4
MDDPLSGLPDKHFACVYVDPPWRFRTYTPASPGNRAPENHYGVMTIEGLRALPVKRIAAPDAHLFMWTTMPMLEQSFGVLHAWGFAYSSCAFVWLKLRRSFNSRQLRMVSDLAGDMHTGLGLTTRKNAELCLLGRRGSPKRLAKDVREVIVAPVREHSRKPDEAIERIERYCPGPRVELFARTSRAGWTSWGRDVGMFGPG